MSQPELLPCPFCGYDAPRLSFAWVICPSCHASSGMGGSQAGAIEIWNRRTPPKANPLNLSHYPRKVPVNQPFATPEDAAEIHGVSKQRRKVLDRAVKRSTKKI